MERDNQGQISLVNNELQRRKEEIESAEMQFNQQWVVINQQEKDLEKKKFELNNYRKENENIIMKKERLKERYDNEKTNLEINHKEWMEGSQERKVDLIKEETRLLNEIQAHKDELLDLQRKQNSIFEMVQKNLNSALENQFNHH